MSATLDRRAAAAPVTAHCALSSAGQHGDRQRHLARSPTSPTLPRQRSAGA